jgi:predicted TIM-barrel fold metal-dependent hydrolase
LAIVALVDVSGERAPQQLEGWAAQPNVRGVRLGATERSPGRNRWAIWEKADELRLSVSFHGLAADYAREDTFELARQFRQGRLVIEHLGRPDLAAGIKGRAFQQVLRYADLPHVSIKISGFHVYSPVRQTRYPEFMPFVRAALDAFGPERCMWGSNFPPLSGAEGFHNALAQARDDWPWRDDRERRLVLGETAASHYQLPTH